MGFYSKRHWDRFRDPTPEQEAARLRGLRVHDQAVAEADAACPLPEAGAVGFEEYIAAVQTRTAWIAARERELWGAL